VFKSQPIDLQKEYPCPCCRGQIAPLVLTEAWGCDRCQKIFVLADNGLMLEQVSSPYPHRWQWNGQHWQSAKSLFAGGLSFYVAILFSLASIVLGTWYFWHERQERPPSEQPLTTENQEH
jgi:hypothetical protein